MDQEKCFEYIQYHAQHHPFYGIEDMSSALEAIPHEEINKQLDQLLASDKAEPSVDRRDLFLAKLMQYFKEELFTWVDKLTCAQCNNQECVTRTRGNPNQEEQQWNARSVEVGTCPTCKQQYRFPRYNHPVKLMETRRGRCGEWAIGFAFICRAFGYDTRLVYDFQDHVWVEVYSEAQRRWVHTDPCENAIDQPLLYSCGWNKDLYLVFAVSEPEVRDVTWRYVPEWKKAMEIRRQIFDESAIYIKFEQYTRIARIRCRFSPERLKEFDERWLLELVEFIRLPSQDRIEAKANERHGRTSGDLVWRLSRCEIDAVEPNPKAVINVDEFFTEPGDFKFDFRYYCNRDDYDIYIFGDQVKEIRKHGWKTLAYQFENIFHMVEKDWKMCYLARRKTSKAEDVGRISWKVTMSPKTASRVNSMSILLRGATFETGQVALSLRCGDSTQAMAINADTHLSKKELLELSPSSANGLEFVIEAELRGGRDDLAWQHAQLFRHALNDKSNISMFSIAMDIKQEARQENVSTE